MGLCGRLGPRGSRWRYSVDLILVLGVPCKGYVSQSSDRRIAVHGLRWTDVFSDRCIGQSKMLNRKQS
jgi:hypothetical protein